MFSASSFWRTTAAAAAALSCRGAAGLSNTAKLQDATLNLVGAGLAHEDTTVSPLGDCKGFQCIQRFVELPDAAYEWCEQRDQLLEGTLNGVAWKGHVLHLVSQRWLGPEDT